MDRDQPGPAAGTAAGDRSRDPGSGAWRILAQFPTYAGATDGFTPVGFAPDGTLYVRAHAGNQRLHHRWEVYSQRNKKHTVATTAIARHHLTAGDRVAVFDLGHLIGPVPAGSGPRQLRVLTAALSRAGRDGGAHRPVRRLRTVRPGTPVIGNGHTVSPQLSRQIGEALGLLYANGYPQGAQDAENLAIIIYNESGGDVGVVNTYDRNAAAGMPSFGLMQTIGPTFDAFALPTRTERNDPVAQIMAGARYAQATYGGLAGVPGVKSLRGGGPYRPY